MEGLSPSFWWWLTIFGIPWLVDASLQSLPASSHGLLPVYLCSSFPFSKTHSPSWIKTHLNDLILTWLHLQKPCFQIRSRSQTPGVRTSIFLLWRNNSICNMWVLMFVQMIKWEKNLWSWFGVEFLVITLEAWSMK